MLSAGLNTIRECVIARLAACILIIWVESVLYCANPLFSFLGHHLGWGWAGGRGGFGGSKQARVGWLAVVPVEQEPRIYDAFELGYMALKLFQFPCSNLESCFFLSFLIFSLLVSYSWSLSTVS